MTDRNIDIALIMALAEESLPPNEAAVAEAALDDASRAELAAQRQALASLASLTPVAMTTDERSAIHDAVRTELNVAAAGETTPHSSSTARKLPWYAKALPALGGAAALILVIGIGLSVGGLGGSDDADTAAVTEAASATTEAEESRLLGEAEVQTANDATAATTAATSAQTTTAAAEAPAEDAAGFNRSAEADDLGVLSLLAPDEIDDRTAEASEQLPADFPFLAFDLPEAASGAGLTCWESVLADIESGGQILYMGIATVDGAEGEVYRTISVDGDLEIYVFTSVDCELLTLIVP